MENSEDSGFVETTRSGWADLLAAAENLRIVLGSYIIF